jgi:hypothetical protein
MKPVLSAVETAVPGARRTLPPSPLPQRIDAYLVLLRDAAARLLGAYRSAWAPGPGTHRAAAGEDSDEAAAPLEDQAVAGIGVRADPAAASARAPAVLPPASGLLADLALDTSTEAIVAAAWWSTVDPQVAVCFGCVHDDAARRYPSLGALRLLLQPYGLSVPLALPNDSGPVADGLLRPVAEADAPVRLTDTAALLLDGWRPQAEMETQLPERLRRVAEHSAALLRAGRRVTLRCADSDDARTLPRAIAARLGRALDEASSRPLAETMMLDRLGLILPAGSDGGDAARLRLAGPGASCGRDWQVIDVAAIEIDAVREAWRRALSVSGLPLRAADELSARLRLSESAIETLRQTAADAARVARRTVTVADLHDAVRRHPQHSLDSMARLLAPSLRLDDLVLTKATRGGLDDLLAHARYSNVVTAAWPGIRGRAVVALLHGASGTGKTAAAEALAGELDRDLWIVDLAQVVSKWLGETQRNLDRLLTEAARAGAILLFDEAEGLFGKRAEITDARDRYANLEIDHLLQRVELHEGLVILTSNRPAGLDQGFQRRLRASVRFELPDHAARQRIWRALLPDELLADGTSVDPFADAELSGGSVRAAALSARVFAAADGAKVRDEHLRRAVRRELEKSGRTWAARGSAG